MNIEGRKYRTTVRFDKKQADFIKALIKKAPFKKDSKGKKLPHPSESNIIAGLVRVAQEMIEESKRPPITQREMTVQIARTLHAHPEIFEMSTKKNKELLSKLKKRTKR